MMRMDLDGTIHTGGEPDTIEECLVMLQDRFNRRRELDDQIEIYLQLIQALLEAQP